MTIKLRDINGRTKAGRRLRALVRAFERDLGGDLSTADLAMVRNAAFLTLQCEQLQARILNGDVTADINNEMVRSTNACSRILTALGIEKRKRKPSHIPLRERLVMERDQQGKPS
jgi:hypothetical protein